MSAQAQEVCPICGFSCFNSQPFISFFLQAQQQAPEEAQQPVQQPVPGRHLLNLGLKIKFAGVVKAAAKLEADRKAQLAKAEQQEPLDVRLQKKRASGGAVKRLTKKLKLRK